jgi:phage-related protein (TIGR01555 family)
MTMAKGTDASAQVIEASKGVKLKGMSMDEYLLQMATLIKTTPENMMSMKNEEFAKKINKAFIKDMEGVNNRLLAKAFPGNTEPLKARDDLMSIKDDDKRKKANDAAGMTTSRLKALDSYNNNMLLLGQSNTFDSFDHYDLNVMLYAWPLWTSLYTSSWVFAKIIDRTGSDLVRNGWKIKVQPKREYQFVNIDKKLYRRDITPEYDLTAINKKQSKVISHIINAARWMYLYGGAVVCLLDDSIKDLREYEDPITSLPKGAKLNFVVADRWQGVVSSTELVDDDQSPDFNTPKYYSVRTPNGSFYRFHHSRVARFVNGAMPTFLKTMLRGWGLPIGTRIYNEINRDERIKNMISSLLTKYNLEIVQTSGMKAYMHGELTPEMESQLDYKLAMINRYRSFNSMMFLDKDDSYQRMDGNVGGLWQLFDSNTRPVTGAASMPTVLLYGDQSQGLSGSSFDDLRLWEDHLDSERGSKLRVPIEKISRWLLMSEKISHDNFSIDFNSSLPKTMNEKIDETRAVLDMYQQLMGMKLYDIDMVSTELKERDDLNFGSQLGMKSKEELEEIQEAQTDDENLDDIGGDFAGGMSGPSGGGGMPSGGGGMPSGGEDFDELAEETLSEEPVSLGPDASEEPAE